MPYTFIMYSRQEKLVPSMTWEVIEFFKTKQRSAGQAIFASLMDDFLTFGHCYLFESDSFTLLPEVIIVL